MRVVRQSEMFLDSQLQQRQVRIAVIGAVLALLRHVVLEYARRFGIVPVETVEDGFDAFGPVGGGVKGYAHGYGDWVALVGEMLTKKRILRV